MPRLITKGSDARYQLARIEGSNKFRESNDCSVISTALACGIPYDEAHAMLAAAGRKDGKGLQTFAQLKAIQDAGFRYAEVHRRDFIEQYPKAHHVLKNVTTHHPERFNSVWADGSNYLLFSRGHVSAVVDGQLIDWAARRQLKVISIYRVWKEQPDASTQTTKREQ